MSLCFSIQSAHGGSCKLLEQLYSLFRVYIKVTSKIASPISTTKPICTSIGINYVGHIRTLLGTYLVSLLDLMSLELFIACLRSLTCNFYFPVGKLWFNLDVCFGTKRCEGFKEKYCIHLLSFCWTEMWLLENIWLIFSIVFLWYPRAYVKQRRIPVQRHKSSGRMCMECNFSIWCTYSYFWCSQAP